MTGNQARISDRVMACLEHVQRLTLGEVELLRALQERRDTLNFVEEQELKRIEDKLDLE